jgi:hypothetical protein
VAYLASLLVATAICELQLYRLQRPSQRSYLTSEDCISGGALFETGEGKSNSKANTFNSIVLKAYWTTLSSG